MFTRPRFLFLRVGIDPHKSVSLEGLDVLLAGILLGVFVAVHRLVLLEVRLLREAAMEVKVL